MLSPTAFSAAKWITAACGAADSTAASAPSSRTSPFTKSIAPGASTSLRTRATDSGEELMRLSRMVTAKPAPTSSTTVCDAIKPAPPVTSTRGRAPAGSAGGAATCREKEKGTRPAGCGAPARGAPTLPSGPSSTVDAK